MGLKLICVGLFFFLIPSYGLIDVMPDCIGVFFILLALSKLRDTDGRLEEAYRLFLKFFFVNLAQTLLAMPVHGLKDGNGDQDTVAILTACLVFSIISAVLLYYALSRLFSGINYIATRAANPMADENYNGVCIMNGLFSVAYYVMLVIPQLVSLSKPSYQMAADPSATFTLYDSKSLITVMCMVVSLLLSILFISTAVGYLGKLSRDRESGERVRELYLRTKEEKKGLITCRQVGTSLIFVFVGVLLTVSFKVEGVNIVPHTISFVLAAVGLFRLAKFVPRAKICAIISLVFAILDGGIFVFCAYVGDRYFESVVNDDTSRTMKALKACGECCEYVMYGVLIFMLFYVMCRLIAQHTGREYVNADSFQATQSEKEKKALLKSVRVRFLAFGLAYCVIGCVFSVLNITSESAWLVPQAALILYGILSSKALFSLHDGISNKYL